MGNKCGCSAKDNQMMDDLDQRNIKPKSRKKANLKSSTNPSGNTSMDMMSEMNRSMSDFSNVDTYNNPTMRNSVIVSDNDFDKKMQFGDYAVEDYSPDINLHKDSLKHLMKFKREDPEVLRSLQNMQVIPPMH